jgi:predicted SprT family Zn-dependent metalloprotease
MNRELLYVINNGKRKKMSEALKLYCVMCGKTFLSPIEVDKSGLNRCSIFCCKKCEKKFMSLIKIE